MSFASRLAAALAEQNVSDGREARVWVNNNGAFFTEINGLPAATKSKIRKAIEELGDDVVNIVVPRKQNGRHKVDEDPEEAASKRVFKPLTSEIRKKMRDIVGGPVHIASNWSPNKAAQSADAIVAKYKDVKQASVNLAVLRRGLRNLEVDKDIIDATFRPDITTKANTLNELRRQEMAAEGFTIPDEYKLEKIRGRVRKFLSNDKAELTGKVVADYLAVFSARPGEFETLQIDDDGKISGMLKKRGERPFFEIVSLVDPDTAREFHEKVRSFDEITRDQAFKDMKQVVSGFGIQPRHLRTIGSHLAVEASGARNDAAKQEVRIMALRHEKPKITAANVFYARVNTECPEVMPHIKPICEQINELEPSQVRMIVEFINAITQERLDE